MFFSLCPLASFRLKNEKMKDDLTDIQRQNARVCNDDTKQSMIFWCSF